MSETASSMPPKGLWSVKIEDFIKGLWLAIGSSILAFGYFLFKNHFKIPTWEQAEPYLDTIVSGFLIYIGKNYGTNNVGEFLKKDKPVVAVSAEKLKVVVDEANDAK